MCLCSVQYYQGNQGKCERCPPGSVCDRSGLTLSSLPSAPAYWRAVADGTRAYPPVFYECPLLEVACAGGPITNGSRDSQCALGRVGVRCTGCDRQNDYVNKFGAMCGKCAPGEGTLTIIGALIVSASLLSFGWLANKKWATVSPAKAASLRKAFQRRTMKFRILINYVQVANRMLTSYRLSVPPLARELVSVLALFEFIDPFSILASPKVKPSEPQGKIPRGHFVDPLRLFD